MKKRILVLALGLNLVISGASRLAGQTTVFSYQGRLTDNGNPANGTYDLQFGLWNAPAGGTRLAGPLTTNGVVVTGGLFTVWLDFGSGPFNGPAPWLEIAVRASGPANVFTTLVPRQWIASTPYAIHAASADSVAGGVSGDGSALTNLNAASLSVGMVPEARLGTNIARLNGPNQTFSQMVTFGISGQPPFAVNSTSQVNNLNAQYLNGVDSTAFWQLGGNSFTRPGTNFIGTLDYRGLDFRVNQLLGLHLEPFPSAIGFAGGNRAQVLHSGSFVWADANPSAFTSSTNNQFRARATGGLDFVTGVDGQGNPTALVQMTATGGVAVTAAVTNGTALEVRRGAIRVTGAGLATKTPAFVHVATASNTTNNLTWIEHPLCNGDPNAILLLTQVLNPADPTGTNAVFNAISAAVYYSGTNTASAAPLNRWTIYNPDGTPITFGAAFNVLVIKP